ncbi:hypothetical protein [Beijerinckia indica]|uniref:Uncharacterized protein n=1 Tax=Beijerinckia indica subsp. indica (strain ATCC 9039 / DSM 1715 / NCIMB 8712) TaxID=395963 RepID=B2ICF1_BEII9|nr:hypothetical protein [Beijerinckia indica]ACB96747.1 hypothetical protein Bind_3187 [Beijerinckia indica subsp. indica ATCC 9039]
MANYSLKISDLDHRIFMAIGLARAGELAVRQVETTETTRVLESVFDAIFTHLKPIADELEEDLDRKGASNHG